MSWRRKSENRAPLLSRGSDDRPDEIQPVGQTAEALACYCTAQALLTALAKAWPSMPAFRTDLAAAAYGPGPLLFLTEKPPEGLGLLWRSRDAQDVVSGDNSLERGVSELADRALPPNCQAAPQHRRADG